MRESSDGHKVQYRHEDRGQRETLPVTESEFRPGSEHGGKSQFGQSVFSLSS